MTDQPDEGKLPEIPKERSSGTPTIVIIAVAAAVFFFCILPCVVIVVLALLGPAIGNVFSEIIDELEATATPGLILYTGFSPIALISLMRSAAVQS